MKNWTTEKEKQVIKLRKNGLTYNRIAEIIGVTANSVKHKIRRLQQDQNQDRYKHTQEKRDQAAKFIPIYEGHYILETHCAFGGMTEFYAELGNVESYDIKKDRVDFVNSLGFETVQAIKGDSEKEIIRLLANGCTYTVVDIDPYGMPSRYFPYVFGLINEGYLFVTLPMIGVAQINKITIRHLEAFWGVSIYEKETYVDKVVSRMKDYAFMHKREIELVDIVKLDRVYRLCIKVSKKSCCDIVGLVVNRNV